MNEQEEHNSKILSDLKSETHIEREGLRGEILRSKNEPSQNEKPVMERTDDYLARNFVALTREAEQREQRLRDDMEQLQSQ